MNSATPELSNLTQTVLRDLADDDVDIADVSVMPQPDIETETIVSLQVVPGKTVVNIIGKSKVTDQDIFAFTSEFGILSGFQIPVIGQFFFRFGLSNLIRVITQIRRTVNCSKYQVRAQDLKWFQKSVSI